MGSPYPVRLRSSLATTWFPKRKDAPRDFSGNLYASNYYTAGTVTVFNPQGQTTGTIGSYPTLDHDNGLAFDQAGYLYVSNYGGNNVKKFNVTTGALVSTLSDSNINENAAIAFSRAGNLYVTNYNRSKVSVFDPAGNYLPQLSISTNVKRPYGITFDSSGNFHVANYEENTIIKFNEFSVFQFKWSTGSYVPFMLATVPIPVPETSSYALATITMFALAAIARRKSARHPWKKRDRGMRNRCDRRLPIAEAVIIRNRATKGHPAFDKADARATH